MITVSVTGKARGLLGEKQIKNLVKLSSLKIKKIKGKVEINIVSPEEIKRLNKKFRAADKITDVLSFAWREDGIVKSQNLGQIFICGDQIARQAKENGIPAEEEFARMAVHGLLHLVGYDHVGSKNQTKMFKIQEEIVRSYVR